MSRSVRPDPRAVAVLTLALVLLPAMACGRDAASTTSGTTPGTPSGTIYEKAAVMGSRVVDKAGFPVALLAEPDGGLLYAQRLTGDIRRIDPAGNLDPAPVASVAVVAGDDDQRGLLGLARDAKGRLFAAWTRAGDGHIVVGQVQPGPIRLAWEGPASARLANGSHLALAPDGRLTIGIGDLLEDRGLDTDLAVPNRKMLTLDPDGAPDQKPVVLSTGWNNPYAFTYTSGGELWVGDNTGGDGPERLGRGDRPASEATGLGGPNEGEVVPSALTALGTDRLAMCTFLTKELREFRIVGGRPSFTGHVLAAPCQTGTARLTDGRVAIATPDQVLITNGTP